jgi:putative nucleotidyltransferase with HDIG domain
MLPKVNQAGFDVDQYLLHSLSTAAIAKTLALQQPEADPMDCFIAGLLHDFGKVVFAQFMPQEFRKALAIAQADGSSLHEALRITLGADHALVGAMLVEKWRFAPELIDSIACQYESGQQDTAAFACVFTANQISKKLGFGFGGNPSIYPLPPQVSARMGGTLEDIIASAGDLNAAFEDAKLFTKL